MLISETRPTAASIFGLIAVFCGLLAWRRSDWSELSRLLLAGVALIYGVIFLAWILELFSYLLTRTVANARAAWYSPVVRQLELIRSMNEVQLAAVGKGLVRLTKIPANAGLVTVYRAPGMLRDLDRETVRELVDLSVSWPAWPSLPPQNGLPGSLHRDELRAFTALVVSLGLAEAPAGPNPARWLVPAGEIYSRLEVS